MLATGLLAAILIAQTNSGACAMPSPAITSAKVVRVDHNGADNRYTIAITVTNTGSQKQAGNVLQSVNIYESAVKVDQKGIPPLGAGQAYTFDYAYQRAHGAASGSTGFTFRLLPQPTQSCTQGGGVYHLRV